MRKGNLFELSKSGEAYLFDLSPEDPSAFCRYDNALFVLDQTLERRAGLWRQASLDRLSATVYPGDDHLRGARPDVDCGSNFFARRLSRERQGMCEK